MSLQYYLPPEQIHDNAFFAEGRAARHIAGAMRLRAGDEITVFNGAGRAWRAVITTGRGGEVAGELKEELQPPRQSTHITLCFAPVPRQAVERIFDECAQLGCAAFRPVVTQRTQFDLRAGWEKKLPRWREIIISACEQCGAAALPEILEPLPFETAVRQAGPALIAAPDAELNIAAAFACLKTSKISLFVGPEGGFTPEELRLAANAGVVSAKLGAYILRAETACAAACAGISR